MKRISSFAPLLVLSVLLPLAAVAAAEKIAWPSEFSVTDLPVERVLETSDTVCMHGNISGAHFIYAKKDVASFSVENAARQACTKGGGGFSCGTVEAGKVSLARGKKSAALWAISVKQYPTRVVLRGDAKKAEMFYRIDISGSLGETGGEWKTLCNEAFDTFAAGTTTAAK